MDVVSALQQVPRFRELNKKGKSRNADEETEYRAMLTETPMLRDIVRYERYAELKEMTGRSDAQEAELKNFEMMYPGIVAQYNRRKLGKGRRRTGRARRGRGRRRYTKRR